MKKEELKYFQSIAWKDKYNNSDRKTILVIDDDIQMLNVIKLYLQDLFDVIIIPSGKLALKYLDKHHADLVLLDYMMPEEDGPAVLKQIREHHSHSKIPVIFLTGVADKKLVMRGLGYRPDGYCLKPVSKDELLDRITSIFTSL